MQTKAFYIKIKKNQKKWKVQKLKESFGIELKQVAEVQAQMLQGNKL